MAIERMKRLKLMAVKPERGELFRKLMLLGCVEISEPERILEDEEAAALLVREGAGHQEYKSDYDNLMAAVVLLNKYAPKKTKLLEPRPEVELETILDESSLENTIRLAKDLVAKEERIRAIKSEESRVRSAIEALEPWKSLDVPMDLTETKSCFIMLGGVPAGTDMAEFKTDLYDTAYGIQLFEISKDRDMHYILILAMKQDKNVVSAFLSSRNFSESSVKGETRATAAENVSALEEQIDRLEKEKERLLGEMVSADSLRDEMKLCADRMLTKTGTAENGEKLLHTMETVVFEGWFPAEREANLVEVLSGFDSAWEIEDPKPEEYPQVPVKLTNGRFARPLNMVTNMYSLPAYGSVDPNPRMAVFFILFYGIMMADMGYGLIMLLVSTLVLRKKRPAEGVRNFFELMFECGISTFVWGIVTGSLFGDMPFQVAKIINPDTGFQGLPALFTPLDNTIEVLIGAMALGVVHIVTGMAINFAKKVRNGKIADALMDEGSWWLLFAGIGIGAFSGFWWISIAGVVALITTQGRDKPTIGGKIIGGVASLYNVTSYLGDILSYSRLMALMLAGSVIGQVFNTIGAIPGNIIVYFIVFALGHTLNLGLNLLGCYVHDLRLQCLEFFGKFYEDGGREFKPLKINTKYYDVVVK